MTSDLLLCVASFLKSRVSRPQSEFLEPFLVSSWAAETFWPSLWVTAQWQLLSGICQLSLASPGTLVKLWAIFVVGNQAPFGISHTTVTLLIHHKAKALRISFGLWTLVFSPFLPLFLFLLHAFPLALCWDLWNSALSSGSHIWGNRAETCLLFLRCMWQLRHLQWRLRLPNKEGKKRFQMWNANLLFFIYEVWRIWSLIEKAELF